jgi:hypothetical protein
LGPVATADTIPQVQNFLQAEIGRLAEASPLQGRLLDNRERSAFEFAKFKLRLRAEVGFDMEFGKISLVPGLELTWEPRRQESTAKAPLVTEFELSQGNESLDSTTFRSSGDGQPIHPHLSTD